MKICYQCKQDLPFSSFNKGARTPDGYNLRCSPCRKTFRQRYKEKTKVTYQKWLVENKDLKREYASSWRKLFPEKKKAQRDRYRAKNLFLVRLSESLKNTKRKTRVPKWLSQEQLWEIKSFYLLRDEVQMLTGDKYHVDHIVPLQGKNVCGLHVPWNLQVLPADINLSKWCNLEGMPGFSANGTT